ncbi:MAG: LPS export ABC transporter ATP-binding protein [Gammaproteobacteria bacterium]|nr:LPS export ABC transporter ATP-binding protein [Gammaproteobacteria bacterium]
MPLLVDSISKSYGRKLAVADVSLEVNQGEIVGLLGPNGAGKTTSFYCIVGLTRADRGRILIHGTDITRAAMHKRARAGLGYLPQDSSVFRRLTAYQNIAAIVELRKDLNKAQRQAKVVQLLEEFGLTQLADSKGEQLSGGERRRLEIARALATEPKFMLFDEPFAGVDPISVQEIKKNIRHLADRDLGVLLTDHNVRETLDLTDRAYIVHDGRIIAEGTSEAILSNDKVREVYLGVDFIP